MGILFPVVGWQRLLCTKEIEKFLRKEVSTKGRLLPSQNRCGGEFLPLFLWLFSFLPLRAGI